MGLRILWLLQSLLSIYRIFVNILLSSLFTEFLFLNDLLSLWVWHEKLKLLDGLLMLLLVFFDFFQNYSFLLLLCWLVAIFYCYFNNFGNSLDICWCWNNTCLFFCLFFKYLQSLDLSLLNFFVFFNYSECLYLYGFMMGLFNPFRINSFLILLVGCFWLFRSLSNEIIPERLGL